VSEIELLTFPRQRIIVSMMIKSTLRKLALLSLGLGLLFAVLPVYATTATGTQNTDLTVSISFEPSCVKVGDTIVRQYSIKNNTNKPQTVDWKWEVTLDGNPYLIYPYPNSPRHKHFGRIQLGPGETWQNGPTTSVIYDLVSQPKGTYAVTLSATNKKGTSSATALFEIYETTCSLGA